MSKIFLYGLSILGLFSNVYAGADGLYTNDNSPNTVALSRSNNVGNMENPFVKKNEVADYNNATIAEKALGDVTVQGIIDKILVKSEAVEAFKSKFGNEYAPYIEEA